MEKYIHYCWFGGKPLPKLAKKCIKSWKKYLPDFQIIEWNESNFDVNMTKFSKSAYDVGKWAFVSDVARIYALKNYGGIYFDTDMLLKKNIDFLFKADVFAGWESEYNVAVGVLFASKKENDFINKLWSFYCENDFLEESIYSLSIPTILTNILKSEYNLKSNYLENQTLKDNIVIYARDYFYPISCDNSPNMFTDRTCMIHYYIGSWLSSSDKKRIKFQMLFGKKVGDFILDFLVKCKHLLKKIGKFVLYPYVIYHRKKRKSLIINNTIKDLEYSLNKTNDDKYIVFCNKNWLGTSNATKELFDNVVEIDEIFEQEIIDYIVEFLKSKGINFIIFSAFSFGWGNLVKEIKNKIPKAMIKVIWHGSPAMNVEDYDWRMFEEIFRLLDEDYLKSIAFVKQSMYEFFKRKNYRVELLFNTVHIDKSKYLSDKTISDYTRIGLYASGDRWVKNFYNQLGAASLFDKVKIDCIPMNDKTIKMAKIFKTSVSGLSGTINREELLKRMAKNDLNFYVTFSECAPLIPLESLELGVPCITSHNHHYWDGTLLGKYLYVEENDNVEKIYEKALFCLKNKDEVLKLYKEWKKTYDIKVKEKVQDFLEGDNLK